MSNRTIPQEVRDTMAHEMMKTLNGLTSMPDIPLPILPDFTMSQQTFVFSIMSALAQSTTTYDAKGKTEPDFERMEAAMAVLVEWLMQMHIAMIGTEIPVAAQTLGSSVVDRPERVALNQIEEELADQGGYDNNLTFMGVNVMGASDQFCRAALFYAAQANPDLKGVLSSIQTVNLTALNYDVFVQAIADAEAAGKGNQDVFQFEGQKVLVGFAREMVKSFESSQKE